jgi:predicted DNA-binding protein
MRTIACKVSDEFYQKIKEKADNIGITISSYLKQSLENSKVVNKKEEQKLIRQRLYELNRIGNNLNQIAKRTNEGKTLILSELVEIERAIKAI